MPITPPLGKSIFVTGVSAAGTTQSTATEISALSTIVSSVPAGSGVRLSPMPIETQMIVNAGVNTLSVYPQPGMTISGLSQDAPFQIAPGHAVGFVVASETQAFAIFGSPSSFA